MLIQTSNRSEAYQAVINLFLKDNRVYCNNCAMPHRRKDILEEKCCEDPQVGTNADHARAVAKQCREIRETRKNDYASTEGKDIRWGVQLPIWMYNALNNYEQKHGRKLINGKDDINWLAREYPQFRIPKEI